MAKRRKIKARDRSARGGSLHRLPVKASIERSSAPGGPTAFMACIRAEGATAKTLMGKGGSGACRFGRNPRQAFANALSAYAKMVRKRSGAFRGLRRR